MEVGCEAEMLVARPLDSQSASFIVIGRRGPRTASSSLASSVLAPAVVSIEDAQPDDNRSLCLTMHMATMRPLASKRAAAASAAAVPHTTHSRLERSRL